MILTEQIQYPLVPRSRSEILKIRNSREWRDRVRPNKLRLNPYCEICDRSGRLSEAKQVDHIVPLEAGGHPFKKENLQSTCMRCHGIKTAGENSERMIAKSTKSKDGKRKSSTFKQRRI